MEQTIKIELSVNSLTSEQKQALATLLGLNVATKTVKNEKVKPAPAAPAAPAAPVEVAPAAPAPAAPAAPVEVAPAAPAAPAAPGMPNVPTGQMPSAPTMPTAPNVQMPSAPVMPTAPTFAQPAAPMYQPQPAAPVAPAAPAAPVAPAAPAGQNQPRVVVMGEQFTFDGINITENAVRMAAGAAAVQGGKRDVIFAKLTEMGFKDVVSLINWWRENHDATYAAMFYEFLKTL